MLIHSGYDVMSAELQHTLSATEEIFRPAWGKRIQVIIEIQILLVKTIYPVQMHLYRIAVEGREEFRRYYVAVKHDIQIVPVRPFRHLGLM